jgi:hypothetical protein
VSSARLHKDSCTSQRSSFRYGNSNPALGHVRLTNVRLECTALSSKHDLVIQTKRNVIPSPLALVLSASVDGPHQTSNAQGAFALAHRQDRSTHVRFQNPTDQLHRRTHCAVASGKLPRSHLDSYLGGLPRFAKTNPCASAAQRSRLANFNASLRCEPGGIRRASSNASSARTPQSYLPVERRVSLLNSLNACVSLLNSPRACVSLLIAPRAPPAGSTRFGSLVARPDLDDVLFPASIFGAARGNILNSATRHQSHCPCFRGRGHWLERRDHRVRSTENGR